MTTHNNGGPAFPCEVGPASDGHTIQTGNMQWMQPGMTLRDYFAAKAMQGFLSGHIAHYGHENHWPYGPLASEAYELADAMLKAREGGATGNLSTERDTLRDAMREIATTEANSNSDPDVMGAALDNIVAVAQGALRACQKQGAA